MLSDEDREFVERYETYISEAGPLTNIHDQDTARFVRIIRSLQKQIDDAPVVYGLKVMSWCETKDVCGRADTHQAKLVDIRKINDKPTQ